MPFKKLRPYRGPPFAPRWNARPEVANPTSASVVDAGGIASGEAFATDEVFTDHAALAAAGGIASVETFGLPTVTVISPPQTPQQGAGVRRYRPARYFGMPPAPLFVSPPHALNGVGGITSGEAFGAVAAAWQLAKKRRQRLVAIARAH